MHECNEKEHCCKLKKDSFEELINVLKDKKSNSNTILKTLEAIVNLFSEYECDSASYFIYRVKQTCKYIEPGDINLYQQEKTKLNMLIVELEEFLNS